MKIKTGIILAAGDGTRLKPHTCEIPKCLVKIKNKPLIYHNLDLFKKLDIEEAIIVVGHMKDQVIDCVKKYESDFKINFIHQKERKGISQAIKLTKEKVSEPFIVILGDEFYWKANRGEIINNLDKQDFDCIIAVKETENEEDIRKNYAVKINEDSRVTAVKEKPKKLWNNYLGCGTYIFNSSIFKYIDKTPVSPLKNEKEITDTLSELIKDGRKVYSFSLKGKYKNINYPSDIEKARKLE